MSWNQATAYSNYNSIKDPKMKLNKTTGKTYDLKGPSDNETANRTGKFPLDEKQTKASAATVTITPTLKKTLVEVTVAQDLTVEAAAGEAEQGDEMIVKLANDGTIRTVTFGTGFKASGTVAGTVNKTIVVSFIYDGTNWFETGRSAAITP